MSGFRPRSTKARSFLRSSTSVYEFDEATDAFVSRSRFEFAGYLGEMLFLSNAGDVIFVSLGEKEAVRLFSRDGTLRKRWDLSELLRRQEIKACAETGSTLQWVDEGSFNGRILYLRGLARTVRALSSPYTVMRRADPKVSFLLTIDAETAKVTKSR